VVKKAVNGNPHAQAELFRAYSCQLYRTAYSVLRNREDAEDALQNCWLSVLANLRSFEGRPSLATWLIRIMINSALMILRKKRQGRELSLDTMDNAAKVALILRLPSHSPNPEDGLLEHDERKIVEQAIGELRPRIRAVLELAQFRELSVEQTARSLGISVPAAKGRLFHARAALRKSTALKAFARKRIAWSTPPAKMVE
jgi:RNA polymerase sigma-70 factor (ECF subfamily)